MRADVVLAEQCNAILLSHNRTSRKNRTNSNNQTSYIFPIAWIVYGWKIKIYEIWGSVGLFGWCLKSSTQIDRYVVKGSPWQENDYRIRFTMPFSHKITQDKKRKLASKNLTINFVLWKQSQSCTSTWWVLCTSSRSIATLLYTVQQ